MNTFEEPAFSYSSKPYRPSIPKLPLPRYRQSKVSKDGESITPLPVVPMTVLCIIMIGEFLSASVAGPFLFFMIEGFFRESGEAEEGLESKVGLWAGIVASTFFLSQLLTSLLWASIGRKHGRRVVLMSSLAGNTISLLLFGTSAFAFPLLLIRFAQGLFNGAVGVARGVVKDVTDTTNEQRAYALVGFCWGMGGIVSLPSVLT
ncbi:MFS general substrate transporter [Atractiella rhizophila]|nr:MFS general substrate transporter [Atractiella rhizophila]